MGDMIPFCEHPFWPLFKQDGFESSANNLVRRDWGLPVKPPCQHDVYIFETVEGNTITWYCRSGLLAVDGVLYFVYYDWNLLSIYCKRLADSKRSEYLRVRGAVLTTELLENGVLKVQGHSIYSYAKCVRMRPPVPWYTVGFREALETEYSRLDQLTDKILILQRWTRRLEWYFKGRRQRLYSLRKLGWFHLLGDDLFLLIIEKALQPSFQIRQHQCEFELALQDDLI